MAWAYLSAATRKNGTAIVQAAVTIYDTAATQQPDETAAQFEDRSRRRFVFTRSTAPDGTFTQTVAQFRDMVRREVTAHIAHRTAQAASAWDDATADFAP